MVPFDPLFQNPHLQTIAAHLWIRDGAEEQFPIVERLHTTEPEVQVLVQSQERANPAGHIVLVHGLEGSGEAGYVRSLSAAALRAGFSAHRFHMRTCGGTERLCGTLYHAGLTTDLLEVIRDFRNGRRQPVFLVGFSLGGNVVLKLAGELGESARELLRAVCAISTPVDLEASARRIGRRDNFVYERRFVRRMRARLCATGRYRKSDFAGARSIFAIDESITAPSFGFGNAANYYRTQSALRYLDRIRVPSLVIHSRDDTLAPFESWESGPARRNPSLEMLVTERGGHLGFLGRKPHRFWLDETVIEWIALRNNEGLSY